MKASYKNRWVSIKTGRGETEVELNRGQFIFGRESAARELKMKSSSVRNYMEKLKKAQNLDMQPDSHYTIVTICKYDIYQRSEEEEGQEKGQASNRQVTGKGQAKDTNNKVYIENKEKKDIYTEVRREIISYLNQKFTPKKNYRPDVANSKKHIDARLKEGYSLDNFKRVIDVKYSQWGNDDEMSKYLRPETLFGTKFDSYLNQRPIQEQGDLW